MLIAKPGLMATIEGQSCSARASRRRYGGHLYGVAADTRYGGRGQEVLTLSDCRFCLSNMALVPRIMEELRQRGLGDLPVFLGGIIPRDDVAALQALGVNAVFGPGTESQTIISNIQDAVRGDPA